MNIEKIIQSSLDRTCSRGESGPIVLSTRIRLARNVQKIPFPAWANMTQKRDILCKCLNAVSTVEGFKSSEAIEMDDLGDLEKQILVERHLISRELSKSKNSGVLINEDQSCAIMINEEDHLRIQMVQPGYCFSEIWRKVDEIDSKVEESLHYAFSTQLGYLTACPTNLGTGLRASVMMHLPGLVLSENMDKVIRMVSQLGIAVRGLFGEGTDATGSIFQISNQQTLGESEEDIIRKLSNVLDVIIEQEKNARLKLAEENADTLMDKIGRARGIMQNGHLMSSEEAMSMLSLMRLAVDMEIIPAEYRQKIDRLLIESQPGHVQYVAKCEALESNKRDSLRAARLRNEFSNLPAIDLNSGLN